MGDRGAAYSGGFGPVPVQFLRKLSRGRSRSLRPAVPGARRAARAAPKRLPDPGDPMTRFVLTASLALALGVGLIGPAVAQQDGKKSQDVTLDEVMPPTKLDDPKKNDDDIVPDEENPPKKK